MSEATFTAWAIVELFGHQRCAGQISEQTIGGETFIRVDIPNGETSYTRLFGKGAIYCINICEEPTARSYASRMTPPLQPYVALPAPADAPDHDIPRGGSFGPAPRDSGYDDDDIEF
jgi:hypothetical protein